MEKPPRSVFFPLLLLFSLLIAAPSPLPAEEITLESDTIVRFFERDTEGGGEDLVAPLYEYLRVSAGDPETRPVTFHLYGWGRLDAADSDFFDDTTAGELLYGYLEYRRPETNLEVRLGRQYVFEGVADESIDGLRIGSDLGDRFSVSAYAGWPVALDSEQGRDGDSIYGGRIAHHDRSLYEIGLSYKTIDNDDDQAEERAAADLALFLPGGVNLYGFSSYNLETEDWGEHFYEARFNLGPLRLRPFFEYFRYQDYFSAGAKTGGPFLFLAESDENLAVFGTDVLWLQNENWEWGLKGKYYTYDERSDDALFFSGLVTWHGEELTQVGGEVGRMDGEMDDTQYLLTRAFFYYDQLQLPLLKFLTGDLVWALYDEDIYGEDNALFLSLGTGTGFFRDLLQLQVSADYSTDPYFDNDLRGWLMARVLLDL